MFLPHPSLYSELLSACSLEAVPVTTACSTAVVSTGYEPRGGGDSDSTMSPPFRKGYSPFKGEPNQYHGWITLKSSVMYEGRLGKVMSGVETAPAAMEEAATQLQKTQHAKECRRFDENNGIFLRGCFSPRGGLPRRVC